MIVTEDQLAVAAAVFTVHYGRNAKDEPALDEIAVHLALREAFASIKDRR